MPLRRCSWKSLFVGLISLLVFAQSASAQVMLTWARVEAVRNRVQLIPQGRTARRARLSDIMGVGDALRTAASARAELRFNDGSLARVGERALFRFTPNTRNFQLSNGTVLLLIPPGRGRTTIQTPNAVTGIQGSALFVRTIPETDTTIIGALTNNPLGPMVAYNQDGSQQQPLYAGQMVVIEADKITHLYDFDLRLFYETSGLVEGLYLDTPDAELPVEVSEELKEVRQEIQQALQQQEPLPDSETEENPSFVTPPADAAETEAPLFSDEFPAYETSPAASYSQTTTAAYPPTVPGVIETPDWPLPLQLQPDNPQVGEQPAVSTPTLLDSPLVPDAPSIPPAPLETPATNPPINQSLPAAPPALVQPVPVIPVPVVPVVAAPVPTAPAVVAPVPSAPAVIAPVPTAPVAPSAPIPATPAVIAPVPTAPVAPSAPVPATPPSPPNPVSPPDFNWAPGVLVPDNLPR